MLLQHNSPVGQGACSPCLPKQQELRLPLLGQCQRLRNDDLRKKCLPSPTSTYSQRGLGLAKRQGLLEKKLT